MHCKTDFSFINVQSGLHGAWYNKGSHCLFLFCWQLGQFLFSLIFVLFHHFPSFVLGSLGFVFLHGAAYKEDW
jgi:hypothetical protein